MVGTKQHPISTQTQHTATVYRHSTQTQTQHTVGWQAPSSIRWDWALREHGTRRVQTQTQHTAHSTQHTAHSTQTQHPIDCPISIQE